MHKFITTAQTKLDGDVTRNKIRDNGDCYKYKAYPLCKSLM